jgi:membrane-associated phospholipid phosphatase
MPPVATGTLPHSAADVSGDRPWQFEWLVAALLIAVGLACAASGEQRFWLLALNAWVAEGSFATVFWASSTQLGLGLSGLVLVLALSRRDHRLTAIWLHALLLGGLLTHSLKWLLPMPRPMAVLPLSDLQVVGEPLIGGGAMPSGHAMTAAALAMLLVSSTRAGWRWLIVAVCSLTILSRVVLAAHWPADVLVGAGLGVLLMSLLLQSAGVRWNGGRSVVNLATWLARPQHRLGLIALEALAAMALALTSTGYPPGQIAQWGLCMVGLGSAVQRWRAYTRQQTYPTIQKPKSARVGRLLIAGVVAVACALWLAQQASSPPSWRSLHAVSAWVWLLGVAALLAVHALRAVRLQAEWAPYGAVSWLRCLRLVLAHNAAVLMLPLRAGEAGYVLQVTRVWPVSWKQAAASLTWWRLQDATVLALLSLLLLAPLPWVPRLVLAAAFAVVAATLLPPAASWLTRRLGQGSRTRPLTAASWLSCSAQWLLKLIAMGGLLSALSGLDGMTALRGALGGELAGVQPVQGPAGLGTYQAGIWLVVDGATHSDPAALLAAAWCVHLLSLSVALGTAALAMLLVSGNPATPAFQPSEAS